MPAGCAAVPLPPALTADSTYEVEAILAHRDSAAGKRSYLVKWKGFTYEECTWEPAKNVTGSARLVQQYKRAAGLNAICHETDDGTRPRHDSEAATSIFDTGLEPRANDIGHKALCPVSLTRSNPGILGVTVNKTGHTTINLNLMTVYARNHNAQ